LALEGLLGLEEEPPGVAPVHDACSRTLIIFRPETAAERTAKTGSKKGSKLPLSMVRAFKSRKERAKYIRTVMKPRM
jgi:hypothetical protein